MRTVVAPLEGNKVKLSVEVDEQEFEKAVDAAFRKIAREVRIPGFRPGKAPRRILEARLGKEAGRNEALRDSLPEFYVRALRDEDVDAIAPPEIDITAGQEGGAVSFDAVVEVRPQLRLAGYSGLRVTVPSPVVSEADIDAQVDRLRGNFAQLSEVHRPARNTDNLTIDIHGSRNGEPLSALDADDFVYELGTGSVLPELDEHLQGAKVGDILAFDVSLPDGTAQLRVLVKQVREKVLPEATDQWAAEASEFDTIEALRADIAKRLAEVKKLESIFAMRSGVVDALVELVDTDPPQALVNSEIERRAHEFGHQLEAQGVTVAQYLELSGQSEEAVVSELRAGADKVVQADLALRAVAESEGLSVSDEELDAEVSRIASELDTKPAALRRDLERTDRIGAVRSDLKKRKALDWLLEHVELVDPEGNPLDRGLLEPEAESQPTESQPQLQAEAATDTELRTDTEPTEQSRDRDDEQEPA